MCLELLSVNDVLHVAHETHRVKELVRGSVVAGSRAFVTGRLFTVAEVAAAMRVSNMTVYRLIRSGELPALRVGKGYRIFEADLERFLEGRSVHVEGG
jgi:excisionase family DNA binding protein